MVAILALSVSCCLILCACTLAQRNKSEVAAMQDVMSGSSVLLYSAQDVSLPSERILETSDYMLHFLRINVPNDLDKEERLQSLLKAMIDPANLGFKYDIYSSYSAEEAFLRRQGNCLSFTLLFVTMARAVGLNVEFNEVEVPPAWSFENTSTYVSYTHINSIVRIREKERVVDLDPSIYRSEYAQKIVSDNRAIAHYYSNRAMSYLLFEEYNKSLLYLLKAIKLAPDVDYFWTNLAVVYRRSGALSEATTANLKALTLNPRNSAAANNLGQIYAIQGQRQKADQYISLAKSLRQNNPYYLYVQAQRFYQLEELQLALETINKAIRRATRSEHKFYALQSRIWLSIGNSQEAEKSIAKALRMATDQRDITTYQEISAAIRD